MIHPKDGIPHPPYTIGPDGRLPLRLAAGRFLASNFHIIILAGLLAFFLYRKVSNMLNTRPPQRGVVIVKSMEEEMRAARARQFEALQREKQEQLEKQKQDEVATDHNRDEANAATCDGDRKSSVSAETGSETKKASNVSPAAAAFMARRRETVERYPDTLAARVTGGHRLGSSSVGANSGALLSAAPANSTASSSAPATRATAVTTSASNVAALPTLTPTPIPPKGSKATASEEKSKNKQQKSSYRFADDSDDEDPRGPRKRLPKLSGGSRAEWEADNGGGGGGGDKKDYFKRACGPRGG